MVNQRLEKEAIHSSLPVSTGLFPEEHFRVLRLADTLSKSVPWEPNAGVVLDQRAEPREQQQYQECK
ncbi:hypothetical protein P7K49_000340 [Saguinus oedipus]|uniref:Uncharacterized protein n=1 Tax=Saguinus oedipus TaxID=9490 RepID=A0ABQ9WBE3_SAGOE|nr:hypothetical protein P7K49_000340 [Saguinus oedipus]